MKIDITLTERELKRLERIQKAYKERGLDYTLSETLNIVTHGYIQSYLDQRLDDIEEQLFIESRRIRAWK